MPPSQTPTPSAEGPAPAAADDTTKASKKTRIARIAGVAVFVAFGVMWAYVFANQGKIEPAAWLSDRRFPEAAEPICAAAMADIDELPRAHESQTAVERAGVVETATDRLVQMQDELRDVVPAGGDREEFIHMWVEDWSIYIEDRYDYAEALRVDESAEFLVTQKYGTQLSKSIDNFAQVNKMGSCETPDDV